MGATARLLRRGGTFYFRMSVPRQLVERVGRTQVWLSLRTTCRYDATLRCRSLSNGLDRLFAEFQRMPQTPTEVLNERIRAFFQQELNRREANAVDWKGDPSLDLSSEAAGVRETIDDLRRQIARNKYDRSVEEVADALIVSLPDDPNVGKLDARDRARRLVAQAMIEASQHLWADLSGEPTPPRGEMFRGIFPTNLPLSNTVTVPSYAKVDDVTPPPDEVEMTLEQLNALFLEDMKLKKLAPKTIGDHHYAMQIVFEVIPPHHRVKDITTQHVTEIRNLIAKLPPNAQKAKSAASIGLKELAASNASGETLSYPTQEKRFRFFKNLLDWAADHEFIEKAPGGKIKVTKPVHAGNENRLPYSKKQLQQIFMSLVYRGRLSVSKSNKPGQVIIKDGKYWVPLIALYTGMRSGEIIQLHRNDVREEDGLWVFVNQLEGDEDKKLKTASSKRFVPIHASLIKLGLLDHVMKTPQGARLFPEIKLGKDGYYSSPFSKWWTRYAKVCGFYSEDTAFHSFRHTFIDAMRDAQATDQAIKQVVGHSDGSVTAGYGKGMALPVLRDIVDRVTYDVPALDTLGESSTLGTKPGSNPA